MTVDIHDITLPGPTVRHLERPETWHGPSGMKVTGDAVAAHLQAAADLMRRQGWDPQFFARHSGRNLYYALAHTADDGLGDDDTHRVAEDLLGRVLAAATGAPYVDYEAWGHHASRTLDDIVRACQTAAAVARKYGPGPLVDPDRYAPVDHPGVTVPEDRRCWSVSWPEYAPVDITPPELRPLELAQKAPGWAEPHATPDLVRDWEQRRAAALVPYALDERGRPLHPHGRTGRTGRNLGKWAENTAADPIVVTGRGKHRRVLLITRDDIGVEAIPGGMVDPGETVSTALVRELREETGIDLTGQQPVILGRQVVTDWRNTDHAWVASVSALYQLPRQVTATAGDDAADAGWFPFGSMEQLDAAVTAAGRTLYAAHRPLLQSALEYLDQQL